MMTMVSKSMPSNARPGGYLACVIDGACLTDNRHDLSGTAASSIFFAHRERGECCQIIGQSGANHHALARTDRKGALNPSERCRDGLKLQPFDIQVSVSTRAPGARISHLQPVQETPPPSVALRRCDAQR